MIDTVQGLQQLDVEDLLLIQRSRAIQMAERNERVLQRRPVYGKDLRELVSIFHRRTEDTERWGKRSWRLTKALNSLVPDFSGLCAREEDRVRMFTVLVHKVQPRGSSYTSDDPEVRDCMKEYESM